MEALAPWTAWAGETIGISALIPLILFAITYQRRASWKAERPGRALMYMVRGLIATIALLVLTGFFKFGEYRWIIEVLVYSPLAWACWNLYFTLRKTLGLDPRFLFRVARKPRDGETAADFEEDTIPPKEH